MAVLSEGTTAKETPPLYYAEAKSRSGDFRDYVLKIGNSIPASLATYIKENWKYPMGRYQGLSGNGPFYNGVLDIPLLIIGYSELTYKEEGILSRHSEYNKYAECIDDFKAVKRMLEVIK